ncbi:uncharacterized protein LOC128554969 [Mercenaria mercenaria]|uniref:uncharacterized protein LOC128554969 n=1 Tax=Mercenaria mercenaria TaxID=6596 RepID=UPI00234EB56E|nr:uncharacterized protein LOC128554969 [Mercenaria mercenaria]
MTTWSSGLKDLYHRSSENLNVSQKEALKCLLEKHKDAFSSSSTDLGRTSIVRHTIEVQENVRPLKIPPRRVPKAFEGQEEKNIQQLEMGIIEERFYQIELDERDREKTAFGTSRGGLYQYVTTMPQGLTGAPHTFQRCMELVFKNLQWRTIIIQ